jgi:primosomal protein N''
MTTLDLVRVQPVAGESLTALLQECGQRVRRLKGKSQAQIARDAWLDESYVSRLVVFQDM